MKVTMNRVIAPELEYDQMLKEGVYAEYYTCTYCAWIVKKLFIPCPNCESRKFVAVYPDTAYYVILNITKQEDEILKELRDRIKSNVKKLKEAGRKEVSLRELASSN